MSMIFKFRMLSDENDAFLREYEVPYDMSLLDFSEFICKNLKYDSEMTSFFLSDKNWEKGREFTSMDMGGDDAEDGEMPVAMASVVLGQIIHKNHDRLIYMFDTLTERAYYLELTATTESADKVRYPRVTISEGNAPDQYNPESGDDEHGSIFDEVMSEFDDYGDYSGEEGGSDDDY